MQESKLEEIQQQIRKINSGIKEQGDQQEAMAD